MWTQVKEQQRAQAVTARDVMPRFTFPNSVADSSATWKYTLPVTEQAVRSVVGPHTGWPQRLSEGSSPPSSPQETPRDRPGRTETGVPFVGWPGGELLSHCICCSVFPKMPENVLPAASTGLSRRESHRNSPSTDPTSPFTHPNNDGALQASWEFQEHPRAGDPTKGIVIMDGMDSIDASLLDTNLNPHEGEFTHRPARKRIAARHHGSPSRDGLFEAKKLADRRSGVDQTRTAIVVLAKLL